MVAPDRPGEQVGSTAQELVGPADANAVCNGCEKSESLQCCL